MNERGSIKVSVILPVLNGMPYFEKAMNSVVGQRLEDIEIIVVDAGSTDGTMEYVKKCMTDDSRIILIDSEKKSHGLQCNIGMNRASGKYVTFCESDDYMEAGMLQDLYEIAVQNDFPECVKSDFYMFVDRDGEEFKLTYDVLSGKREMLYNKEISIKDFPGLIMRDINMWNGIVRTDFITENKIRLNETPGASFQDVGFVQQVNLLAQRQIYVHQPYYHYRQDNMGSSVYKKERSLFALQECEYAIKWLGSKGNVKHKYGLLAVARLLNMFVQFYSEDKYKNNAVSYDDKLQSFQKEVIDFIIDYGLAGRSVLEANTLAWLFLNDLEQFRIFAKIHRKKEECAMKTFRDSLRGCMEIVILTSGDIGQSVYALLVCNDWRGKAIFCDNNTDKQGTQIMGVPVLSVEQAVKDCPDALYIVNPNMYGDLSEQLISNGIYSERIIYGPFVFPHTCMGIDLNCLGTD